jgi:hypothetical protein
MIKYSSSHGRKLPDVKLATSVTQLLKRALSEYSVHFDLRFFDWFKTPLFPDSVFLFCIFRSVKIQIRKDDCLGPRCLVGGHHLEIWTYNSHGNCFYVHLMCIKKILVQVS